MIFFQCHLTENIGRRSRASLIAKVFSWPKRYVNKCEKNSPENLNGQYWENSWQFGMYTEPKRAHYEEQFEHNEKVGRRICCCHLPISELKREDFAEIISVKMVKQGKVKTDYACCLSPVFPEVRHLRTHISYIYILSGCLHELPWRRRSHNWPLAA